MDHNPARPKRIGVIDLARAIALIAMALYHLTWDLELFGYVPVGTTRETGWILFARSIAFSFLFLAGISLVLAHGRAVRWRKFWIRFAQIAGSAVIITIATYFVFPDAFIFFGILHQIAFASLVGLAALRIPALANLVLAAAIIALPFLFRSSIFDSPALVWLGLSPVFPRSNDFVPVFPWTGVVLLGIAAAQWARASGVLEKLRNSAVGDDLPLWTTFIGRHSLVFYLLHQPILLGQVWLLSLVFAPPAQTVTIEEARPACEYQCQESADEAFCARYCGCVLGGMQEEGLLTRRGDRGLSGDQLTFLRDEQRRCIAQSGETGVPARQPAP